MGIPGQKTWQRLAHADLWTRWQLSLIAALGAAMLAVALVGYAAWNWGPGANSDGLTYLILARYIHRVGASGYPLPDGTWRPVTHFPPGYPLLIASVIPWVGDEATAALVVNLASLAVLILLASREVFQATRHLWPVAAVALWLAVAFPLLRIFAWVFSEGPFLALLLLVSWSALRWMQRPHPARGALTGLLIAWAVYVRWIGVFLVPWVLTLTWTTWVRLPRKQQRGRWMETGLFLLASGLPMGLLFLASRWVSGAVASRALGWHPPNADKWMQAAETLTSWISPPFVELAPSQVLLRAGGLLAVLVVLIAWAWRVSPASRPFLLRWSTFAFWYMFALVAAITLMDASTPMDWRLLVPVFVAVSLLFGAAAWQVFRPWWPALLLLAWAWLHLLRTAKTYDEFYLVKWHRIGAVLRSEPWQTADVWPILRNLPPEVVLYANEDVETLYYVDRPVWRLLGRPIWRDGRPYVYDPVRKAYLPLPYNYTRPEDWARYLAEQNREGCAVLALIRVGIIFPEEEKMFERMRQDLMAYFLVWKDIPSALLLRSERCTTLHLK